MILFKIALIFCGCYLVFGYVLKYDSTEENLYNQKCNDNEDEDEPES